MNEFQKYYEDEFFIIDSNNLDSIEKRLYGYAVQNNNFIMDKDVNEKSIISDMGSYIFIKPINQNIEITQDFNGCYGLYVYQDEDYFAISNSFIKLVDYLKYNHPISFNKDYADAFLFADLCSYAYKETLVNEINVIPRNYIVHIDKINKTIDFEEIDYEEHSIYLNTEEGIESLDKWYFKWIETIRSIRKTTNFLSFDLSGGFDSRIIAALWLTANIELDNVRIYSTDNDKHVFSEDFRIASKIAKDFNFNLNHPLVTERIFFDDLATVIESSFYIKLGFHKQMYFRFYTEEEPYYAFTGHGGGCIRGHPNQTNEEYINSIVNRVKKYEISMIEPSLRMVESGFKQLKEIFNIDDNPYSLPERMYKEGRNRNHFGKIAAESFLGNRITFTPLIDSDLHKINVTTPECNDSKLLIAMIYVRYCPKLLEYEFEGGRTIDPQTIEYAKSINEKYPFTPKTYDFIPAVDHKVERKNKEKYQKEDPDIYLKNIFYSQAFEYEFKKYYPSRVYDEIKNIVENRKFFPLREVYASIAILKVLKAIDFYNSQKYITTKDWLDDLPEDCENNEFNSDILRLLSKYATARIDIKNIGSESNTIEIMENSDKIAKINNPNWFKNKKGIGTVVVSRNLSLDLKFKCVGDGELNIKLKGLNVKDQSDNRFPVFIDYTKFKINGENILENSYLASHDHYYNYSMDVKDSDIISFSVEWMPFNDSSDYSFNNYMNLLSKYATARVDIKNIGSEENSIEILENSDNLSKVQTPDWFSDEKGKGTVIRSIKQELNLKVKCHNEGTVNIKLRGVNVKDKSDNRFPVYIDFTKFKVNGENIINENQLVSHDDFYLFKKDVKDNEILYLSFEWSPFNDLSNYVIEENTSLKSKLKKLW